MKALLFLIIPFLGISQSQPVDSFFKESNVINIYTDTTKVIMLYSYHGNPKEDFRQPNATKGYVLRYYYIDESGQRAWAHESMGTGIKERFYVKGFFKLPDGHVVWDYRPFDWD